MEIYQTNHPIRLGQKNVLQYLDNPHTGEVNNEVLANFHETLKITRAGNVLEVGFNRGNSALAFLMLDEDLFVTSIDIVYKPKSLSSLKLLFGDRFAFYHMNSADLLNNKEFKDKFDLIFIDADHSPAAVERDTTAALSLKPRFLLYDDFSIKEIQDVLLPNPRLKLIREYTTDQGQGLFLTLPA